MQQTYLRLGTMIELSQGAPEGRKRVRTQPVAEPKRDSGVWLHVTVLRDHPTVPQVECNFCQHVFVAGTTRIRDHLCDKCVPVQGNIEEFKSVKEKLVQERELLARQKSNKRRQAEVDFSVSTDSPSSSTVAPYIPPTRGQLTIQESMLPASNGEVDEAIAQFFYGCNISSRIVNHPLFIRMVKKLRQAPLRYKVPDRGRLSNDLLDTTYSSLKRDEAPLRSAVLKDCGTVISDGWDNVAKDHLINFLVGNSKGFFFDGTYKLKSEDSENAAKVAQLICAEIVRQGPLNIVQVVTDTCAVMKAAWKMVEKAFPWITCTCCAPHVISLELHDMAKIPDVAAAIRGCQTILARFWGRTRWARTRLRELIKLKHNKDFGLYRAKVTRFAGVAAPSPLPSPSTLPSRSPSTLP